MRTNALRYHWIDNIKVFALYLVVLGHIGTSSLHHIIYGFHMPLFFLLSGMLHKDKPVADMFKRLVIPYILFNIIYLALESPWLYRQYGNVDFLLRDVRGIVYPTEHPIDYPTWFLLSLFEIKLIVKGLRENIRLAFAISVVLIAICCILDINHDGPFLYKNTLIGLSYYCMGHLLYHVFTSNINAEKRYVVCISGGVNVVLYLIAITQLDSCVWNEAIALPMQFVYSIIGCLGVLLLFKGCLDWHSAILEKCSIGAVAIIGLHPLLIQYCRRAVVLMGGSWGDYPVMIDMLIAAIVMLLCMLTIPFVIKYFPLLIGLKRKV